MIKRISAFTSGLHFRFLGLVIAVAALMLATQLISDAFNELEKSRNQRLNEALGVTNVIARSLEGQFEFIELDDIEAILSDIRSRGDVQQLTVVDRHKTFYLDGDLLTSPIVAVDHSEVQKKALETGKTAFLVTEDQIQVGEPLLSSDNGVFGSSGTAIGSVMIAFHNPGLGETLIPIIKTKLTTVLPILLIGLLLAAKMVSQITAPLLGLAQTAKKFPMVISKAKLIPKVLLKSASLPRPSTRWLQLSSRTFRRSMILPMLTRSQNCRTASFSAGN